MKKSGFAVKITAFIEADPKSMESMNGAMQSISLIGEAFTTHCFRDLKLDSRFMLSKDIPDDTTAGNGAAPDEPKAAEAQEQPLRSTTKPMDDAMRQGMQNYIGKTAWPLRDPEPSQPADQMPPIPAAMKRT